jgi:hypothetical protein
MDEASIFFKEPLIWCKRAAGARSSMKRLLVRPRAGVIYHMKEELVYLGVDIAKSYLDAAIGNEKRRFSNDAIGHRQLIEWIKQLPASVQVICEPSGGYERALVRAVVGAQLKISLVPASRCLRSNCTR